MSMEQVLLAATAVDLIAVVALGWLVVRGARERDLVAATQRDTLERLRADLQHLLEEAETRARALERTLGAREDSLRATLADVERGAGRHAPAPPTPRRAPSTAAPRSWIDEADDEVPAADPAELRLRRELELSLGKSRLA